MRNRGNQLGVIGCFCLLFGLLAGCAHHDPDALPASGKYVLFTIDGEQPNLPEPVTLELEPARLFGEGPVNRWQAPINDGRIGQIAITRMMGPPGLMNEEARLIQAMENSRGRQGPDGQIEFYQNGKLTAVYLPRSK